MGDKKTFLEKGLGVIGKNFQKEAIKSGSVLRSEFETVLADDKANLNPKVSQVLSSIVFGGGDMTPVAVMVFRLGFDDFNHWYFQPQARTTQLPGEHHALLPGSAPRSWLTIGTNWCSDDDSFVDVLAADMPLMKLSKKVSFHWQGFGVKRTHECAFQIRPAHAGWLHVAMIGGGYGFWSDKVGFKLFTGLCGALRAVVDSNREVPETDFFSPLAYSPIVIADAAANRSSEQEDGFTG